MDYLDAVVALLVDDRYVAPAHAQHNLDHRLHLMVVGRNGAREVLEALLVAQLRTGGEERDLRAHMRDGLHYKERFNASCNNCRIIKSRRSSTTCSAAHTRKRSELLYNICAYEMRLTRARANLIKSFVSRFARAHASDTM